MPSPFPLLGLTDAVFFDSSLMISAPKITMIIKFSEKSSEYHAGSALSKLFYVFLSARTI
jgi:hypothetical protein